MNKFGWYALIVTVLSSSLSWGTFLATPSNSSGSGSSWSSSSGSGGGGWGSGSSGGHK